MSAYYFNSPPGWPMPPQGWEPPPGWAPDPSWPLAPPEWVFWLQSAGAFTGPIQGYDSRPVQNVHVVSAPKSAKGRGVFSWMWRHKFLSWMLFMAASCLVVTVLPSRDLITVLGLIAAIPIGLWMLKWFFWHLLLGGGRTTPTDRYKPDDW